MPFAQINDIDVHYQIAGEGPPLLLFAPGGFRSVLSRWTAEGGKGVFKEMDALRTLAQHFTVIAYDRRESGLSGGRIEPLSWDLYVEEALGVLDLAGAQKAFVLGACMGASLAMALAARHPTRCQGLLLHWPVAGYRWMKTMHDYFDRHVRFVREHGLAAVVERAPRGDNFFLDPEIGPWGSPTVIDPAFAAHFLQQPIEPYLDIVCESRDRLFADTMPSGLTGAELMTIETPALIMSGSDWAHTRSGAWTIQELMPAARLWEVWPEAQTAGNTLAAMLEFMGEVEGDGGERIRRRQGA